VINYDQGISTKILLEQVEIETSDILTNAANIYQPNLAQELPQKCLPPVTHKKHQETWSKNKYSQGRAR
jgi:hypothetical protein